MMRNDDEASTRSIRPQRPHNNNKTALLSLALMVLLILTAIAASQYVSSHLSHKGMVEIVDEHNNMPSMIDETATLPPLMPLQAREYVGFSCAILGLVVAAGGGIGGGGILVPVYTLVLQLPIKHAITLTSVTVLGGAVANNLLNYSKRHPLHPSRHVVDWDLILMLEPMTIAGAMSGAVINEFLSDVMVVLLLLVLLLFTAYKTLTKAVDLYHKETQLIMEAKRASTEEGQNLINNGSDNNNNKSTSVAYGAAADIGSATMTETTTSKEEAAHQIWLDIVKLSSLFVIVTVINLLKGGLESSGRHRVQLNLFESCGNACFWVSNAVIVLIILAFVVHTRTSLLKRVQSGGPVISDIAWDEHNTIQYPLYAIAAGLVAGMFGIGGGIIKGPLMLALGVHPAVASATSACMILFTSFTATLSFMVFGRLTQDYAIACLLIGFVSTLVGQSVMTLLTQRYQRHSYVAFSIGFVVALSAICMTAESVTTAFLKSSS